MHGVSLLSKRKAACRRGKSVSPCRDVLFTIKVTMLTRRRLCQMEAGLQTPRNARPKAKPGLPGSSVFHLYLCVCLCLCLCLRQTCEVPPSLVLCR